MTSDVIDLISNMLRMNDSKPFGVVAELVFDEISKMQNARIRELEASVKAIEEYETLAKKSGCGDGNCVVWKPTGMHTNGGCACVRTASYDHSLRATIDQLLRIAQKAAGAAATVKGE